MERGLTLELSGGGAVRLDEKLDAPEAMYVLHALYRRPVTVRWCSRSDLFGAR
jgi:hypothetical protein